MTWDIDILEKFARDDERLWAPDFARAVNGLATAAGKHLSSEAIGFIESTVITENFERILKEVYTAVARGGTFKMFLNVDMGFGKTHLLTYALYTLYGREDLLKSVDPDIRKRLESLGLSEIGRKKIVIFAFDFRNLNREHFNAAFSLLEQTLTLAKEDVAAKLVKESREVGEVPSVAQLFDRVSRDVAVVVLLDELYYPATRSKEGDLEDKITRDVITFVKDLMEQESGRRPLVVLAASARKDEEYAEDIKHPTYKYIKAFVDRLARYQAGVEGASWLSLDDAMKIIQRRLKIEPGMLHPSMRKFAERFIGPDPDLGNQHLRSLIRAVARMALNASKEGRPFVSVADFDTEVLDFLFLGSQSYLAKMYKAIFEKSLEEVKSRAGRDAMRALFALTVVSNWSKLKKMIWASTSELRRQIPKVTAVEMQQLLEDLRYTKDEIRRAFDELESLPYVIKTVDGGQVSYYVAFVESPTVLLKREKEEALSRYRVEREKLVGNISHLIRLASAELSGVKWLSIYIFEDPEEVEKELKPDKFHLLLHRGAAADIVEKVGRQNFVAVAVNLNDEDVLKNFAEYFATRDTIGSVVSYYLGRLKSVKAEESDISRIERKILEAVRDELYSEMRIMSQTAIVRLVDGICKAFKHAYVYVCEKDEYEKCSVKPVEPTCINVSEGLDLDGPEKVQDKLENMAVKVVSKALRHIAEELATSAYVVYEPKPGLVAEFVKEQVDKYGEVDVPTSGAFQLVWRGKRHYVLPTALSAVEDVAKQLSNVVDFIRDEDGFVFRRKAKKEVATTMSTSVEQPQKSCVDQVTSIIRDAVSARGWGVLGSEVECDGAKMKVAEVARSLGLKVFGRGDKVLVVKPGTSVSLRELLQFLPSADSLALTLKLEAKKDGVLQLAYLLSSLSGFVKEVIVE